MRYYFIQNKLKLFYSYIILYLKELLKPAMSNKKSIYKMNMICLENEKDRSFLVEQYKALIEIIYKNNDNREGINNFWTTLHGTIFAVVAYVKDMQIDKPNPKNLFIWVLWGFGIIMSILWLKSISSIKNNIDLRNEIFIEMEKFLPVKIFTITLVETGRIEGKASLSSTERIIPDLFFLGYLIMGTLLLIYPNII